MSSDLNAMLNGQQDIHGRISRSMDNLKKMGTSNVTPSAVDTRVKILDQLWAKFEAQHEHIRTLYKEQFGQSEYVKTDFFDIAECTYVQQRSALIECGNRLKAAIPRIEVTNQSFAEHAPKTSLPRIKLQPFSGTYEDWPTFRDLFLAVIGENAAISNVERFHYLKSCVQGPAEKLIRSLTVTGDNYDRAWALLCAHFENKRELIRSNFAAFTAVSRMKGDTAEELSRVYHAVTGAVNAQESINRPIASHGMDLFHHLIVELFDPRTRLEWESSISDSSDPPEHDTLMNFMSKRILTLNAAKPKGGKVSGDLTRTAKTHVGKHSTHLSQCALCKGKHSVMLCDQFKVKTATERKAVVEANRLCYNCLGTHQVAKCQSTRTCSTCNSRHHSMLHEAYIAAKTAEVSVLSSRHDTPQKAILLATARVSIADRHGEPHTVRALIDQGSEVSIVSEALVQSLHLRRARTTMSIFGIGGNRSGSVKGKVTLKVTSLVNNSMFDVVAYVLPRLGVQQSSTGRTIRTWPHIQGLPLADPLFSATDPIDLLLGAEVCSIILEDGIRKGAPPAPIAQRTQLGWILSGGRESSSPANIQSLQCVGDHSLEELVHRFWQMDAEVPAPVPLTPDEKRCEELFVNEHRRTSSGRYMVRLPFVSSIHTFGDTRKPAERLLQAMERKFRKDARFGDLYRSFLQEYEDLGHMSEVSSHTDYSTERCYLPHHGVLKESSTTTKLRVVFNGSQNTESGESLNSNLLTGANLLPSLADILLRWRWQRYAFIADIEKMYRQILVLPEDRMYQRILWRPKVTEEVREFALNTVTYGLACAPFLAIRTLRQLADDETAQFPNGATALHRDTYVDDIVTGTNTLDDAIALQRELRNLCTAGGFPLRKWAANDARILAELPREHCLQKEHLWEHEGHATLGLRWIPSDDTFAFSIRPHTIDVYTKRRVLAETARLFDPLGWLAPVVIRAKILIQSTWLEGLGWDTPLPPADAKRWHDLLADLPKLAQLRVMRWVGCRDGNEDVELHGFADASERGYAAALYLRRTRDNEVSVTLLAAKSKVAPIRVVSLPRLELCAATLLVNLTHHTRSTLNLSTAPVFLWSDSTVTLQWIQGHASRWKTYVANRVSQIQRLLPEAHWRHVSGRDNPADCASRGISPAELINHPLWWRGPGWLSQDETAWPGAHDAITLANVPEEKVGTFSAAAREVLTEPDVLLQCSTLQRLLRVTAWCLRWRNSTKGTRPITREHLALGVEELDTALEQWIRRVQAVHYPDEIAMVKACRPASKRGSLIRLNPILDERGILRVGGRLKNAVLTEDERHPMIIPPTSWLTRLIVEACHRRTMHGGVQLTLGMLRLRYWTPRGRSVVKAAIHRCVTCTRWKATTLQPPMGSLPSARVVPSRPFTHTGVDYAGPIFVRTSKGRGQKAHKAFIAVFICMCTRAVHLEVVSDYTTDAFLAALRRFTSRRGLCSDLYSDCGTNFRGADKQLRELFRASSADGRRIATAAADSHIRWHFNPPATPHFGGLWEAAVKSTKYHLRRVIGDTRLTFEEMSTLLAQVEACLNSRPLQPLSDDIEDCTALTPGHFLTGAPLLALPAPVSLQGAGDMLARWRLIQHMRDNFWDRWSREYVHGLAALPKWFATTSTPRVGTLCLLRSETTPPTQWPLCRIVKLHPGDDGVTRVVTVRTAKTEYVRPLNKLVLLPNRDNDS